MSDIDDLLDDLEREELFQERKATVTKNKQNFLDEPLSTHQESKSIDNTQDILAEILEQYGNDPMEGSTENTEDSPMKKGKPSTTSIQDKDKTPIGLKKPDKKLSEKLDMRFTSGKRTEKKKLAQIDDIFNDPFFSKPKPKSDSKKDLDLRESIQKIQIENNDNKSSEGKGESSKLVFETEKSKSNKGSEIFDNQPSSLELSSKKELKLDPSISPEKSRGEYSEKSARLELLDEGQQAGSLEKNSSSGSLETKSKPESASITEIQDKKATHSSALASQDIENFLLEDEDITNQTTESQNQNTNANDNFYLELLLNKSQSRLFKRAGVDAVFVPGKQKIIRKRVKQDDGSPNKFQSDKSSSLAESSLKASSVRKGSSTLSSIRIPEDPLYTFEKEDYEATRPLFVDSVIKNFLVSENPYVSDYTVPLTQTLTMHEISRPFYLEVEGGTTMGKPKCILRISEDMLAVGTTIGQIHIYHAHNYTLTHKLGGPKETVYGAVTAMDLRENTKFLVVGYEKGAVIVWDITSKSPIKVNANLHDSMVVIMKIIRTEPSLQYFSIDTGGTAMLTELEKLMVFYNQDSQCIFSKASGLNFIQLEILNTHYSAFLKQNRSGEAEQVIAIAATQQIVFFSLDTSSKATKVLYKYPRPPIVYEEALPYICWYEYHNPEDSQDVKYWLLIAWGFCLFAIESVKNNDELSFREVGYMKFGAEINHLSLIDDNLLLVLDHEKFLHLIHADDFQRNNSFILPDGTKPNNLQEDISIYSERLGTPEGFEPMFQSNFQVVNGLKTLMKLYHSTITTLRDAHESVMIYNNNIYKLKLNEWREILDFVEKENDYIKLFTIGLALYNQNIKEVSQNEDENERKQELRNHFKDQLRRFITSQLIGKDLKSNDPSHTQLQEEVTLTLIDFCLETEMEDFLFDDGVKCMATMGLRDLFLKSLEAFIRLNKIHYFAKFETLKEVIAYYHDSGKTNLVQQLIANLDITRWHPDDREILLLTLMTICLETDLYTALVYLCIRGSENFTLPFFTFLNKAIEADVRGQIAEKRKYTLRCLWYIKTIFKRSMLFEEETISEGRMIIILRDLILLVMEDQNLRLFYQVEPHLTTVLLSMLFGGELSLLVEDLYGRIKIGKQTVSETSSGKSEYENNLHFQMLNKITEFSKEFFPPSQEKERKACISFIFSKVVENQRHKFMNETVCMDLVRYIIQNHEQLESFIILDYRTTSIPLKDENGKLINPEEEIRSKITNEYMIEKKATIIERFLIYIRSLLKKPEILSDLIRMCDNTIFAEPMCYLLSLRKEYKRCFERYFHQRNPAQTKKKCIQWAMTTMAQLLADKDPSFLEFKSIVYEKIEDLVIIDPEKTKNLIYTYFKDEEKAVILKLGRKPDVQLQFLEKIVHSSKSFIDDELIELHIKLLCESPNKEHHKRVLPELEAYGRYPPACLEIVKAHKMKEAWAFLEEKQGNANGILVAIDLRFEIFEDCFQDYLKEYDKLANEHLKELEQKLVDTISILKAHFSNDDELWFKMLEKLLEIEQDIMLQTNSNKVKQEYYKSIFRNLLENAYLDEIVKSLPFEIIMTEVTKRAGKIPMGLVKEFLTRILTDNYFEHKLREDSKKLQIDDMVDYMKIHLIPAENKATHHINCCATCMYIFVNEPAISFACGHLFHANSQCLPSKEAACPVCTKTAASAALKFLSAKSKRPLPQDKDNTGFLKLIKEENSNNALSNKAQKEQAKQNKRNRFESRMTIADKARDKNKKECENLVAKYHIL